MSSRLKLMLALCALVLNSAFGLLPERPAPGPFPVIPLELTHPDKALPELLDFQRLPSAHDLVSSEETPEQARPVLEGAPEGVYVSVGGFERATNGLLQTSRPTHILLVDYDPYVVMYNAINLWLLRVSSSREDYWALRMKAGFAEWQARAREHALSHELDGLFRLQARSEKRKRAETKDPKALAVLDQLRIGDEPVGVARAFEWWNKWVRKDLYHGVFKKIHESRSPNGYFFDDARFGRVHKMASQGRIAVTRIDLRDSDAIKRLAERVVEAGIPLSVVDLSNAWWPNYIAPEKVELLLRSLSKVNQKGSRVLLAGGSVGLGYVGFSVKNLLSRPSLRDFFLDLQQKPESFSKAGRLALYQP